MVMFVSVLFFFFTDTATTEIYTLSLHDALPIFKGAVGDEAFGCDNGPGGDDERRGIADDGHRAGDVVEEVRDRKSTRLNSSHTVISYAVFCLKKKKQQNSI